MNIKALLKKIILSNRKYANIFFKILTTLDIGNKFKISSNNLFYNNGLLLNSSITVNGNNNKIIIGDLSRLYNAKISISGNNNTLKIGSDCVFTNAFFYMKDNNNQISIGSFTTISGETHMATLEGTEVTIGNDCMFSSNIDIRTSDSHSIIGSEGKRLNIGKNISIGNHCWIGRQCILLKGVSLYDNSIVAAGSVVTKKFDNPNSIIAGNPAKVIKQNINWLRERI